MNIVIITKILFFTSFIIWLLPPIRQFKTRFFYYFLILAIIDPISLTYMYLLKTSVHPLFHIISTYFLLLAILSKKQILTNFVALIILLVVCFLPTVIGLDTYYNFAIIVLIII